MKKKILVCLSGLMCVSVADVQISKATDNLADQSSSPAAQPVVQLEAQGVEEQQSALASAPVAVRIPSRSITAVGINEVGFDGQVRFRPDSAGWSLFPVPGSVAPRLPQPSFTPSGNNPVSRMPERAMTEDGQFKRINGKFVFVHGDAGGPSCNDRDNGNNNEPKNEKN